MQAPAGSKDAYRNSLRRRNMTTSTIVPSTAIWTMSSVEILSTLPNR